MSGLLSTSPDTHSLTTETLRMDTHARSLAHASLSAHLSGIRAGEADARREADARSAERLRLILAQRTEAPASPRLSLSASLTAALDAEAALRREAAHLAAAAAHLTTEARRRLMTAAAHLTAEAEALRSLDADVLSEAEAAALAEAVSVRREAARSLMTEAEAESATERLRLARLTLAADALAAEGAASLPPLPLAPAGSRWLSETETERAALNLADAMSDAAERLAQRASRMSRQREAAPLIRLSERLAEAAGETTEATRLTEATAAHLSAWTLSAEAAAQHLIRLADALSEAEALS